MAKCIVESCQSTNRELFCAPDDKNKLRKWKQILKLQDLNEFLICDIHFHDKFKRKETFLLQDSFPTLLLNAVDYIKDDSCQSCLKKFESNDKICVSEAFKKFFFEQTSFEIKLNSYVCGDCHEKFTKFDEFLKDVKDKQELKKQQLVKIEPIDITDNDNDSRENEEITTYPHFILENETTENPQILREILTSQNSDIPENYLNQQTNAPKSSKNDKKVEVKSTPQKPPTVQNYLIPIRDEETSEEQHVSETETFKNKPMVVIPNIKLKIVKNLSQIQRSRSKSTYEPSIERKNNLSVQHDHGLMANIISNKRRNSVASVLDASETIKKRVKTMNMSREPTICSICQLEFRDVLALKLHQENDHKLEMRPEKPENFRCSDCNETFTSYYFLRKHKDSSCGFSLHFKCTQQYCRFRSESAEGLINHTLETHSNQTICKICKTDFETLERLKNHEMTEHSKKRLRKQNFEIKPDSKLHKVRFSSNFDRTESKSKAVKCPHCYQSFPPEVMPSHIKQHLNTN